MTNEYIKNLIEVHKIERERIADIQDVVANCEIENDKDKANFGNLCLILKASRIICDATEAMLANEDVILGADGEFYQKVGETETETPVEPEIEPKDEATGQAKTNDK